MSRHKISMQKIADELGISKASVHRALLNKAGVSEDLKSKILQIVKQTGYENKSHNNNFCFAYIAPRRLFLKTETFYSTIYLHLNNLCNKQGYILNQFIIDGDDEKNIILPDLQNSHFNGIFISGEISKDYIKALDKLEIPIVLIDFYDNDFLYDSVIAENFLLGYTNTIHLINAGHKRIGFVGNYLSSESIMDRYLGYNKALIENSLDHTEDLITYNNDFSTGLYTTNFKLPNPFPTAFVCYCDTAAYYLIEKLLSMNIKVPDDISIISFDNTDIAEKTIPPLTSVDICKEDFAKISLQAMIKRVKSPNIASSRMYVKTKLIIRESVKPL